jgi:hypothetical protein
MTRVKSGIWTILILLSLTTVESGQGPAIVRFAVEPPDSVVQHQPIGLVVTLQNDFDEEVSFGNDYIFDFQIVPPDGKTAQLTGLRSDLGPRLPDGDIGFVRMLQIAPAASKTTNILLKKFYDFSMIGRYQLLLIPRPKSSSGRKLQIIGKSKDPILITVGPKNDDRLRNVCSTLADDAVSNPKGQVRYDSAEALSWVIDPVAIPFLRRTLEEADGLRYFAVDGLVRIGTSEAYDAMIASNMLKSTQVGSYVSAVLKREESRTLDKDLKTRIHSALQR